MSNAPIGIFDSGLGGLTVVKAIQASLPRESLIYIGDTARVPYGTKSLNAVQSYAASCADFLADHGAKLIVIACNTATAAALRPLQNRYEIPVIGVIEPGATAAQETTSSGTIGVIATEATIASGAYLEALLAMDPNLKVHAAACPLLVPFAEEGLTNHPACNLIISDYLTPLIAQEIDTLLLGCTHYPILTDALRIRTGPSIKLVDSAQAVAKQVCSTLTTKKLESTQTTPSTQFFATDVTNRFVRIGSRFLGYNLSPLTLANLTT